MFNSGLVKEAKESLKQAIAEQKNAGETLQNNTTRLYHARNELKVQLDNTYELIN